MPDIQRSLFAGYPTTNVATANNPRQDAIDRAFEKADKEVMLWLSKAYQIRFPSTI
jgi:hypothetical protein